MRVQCLGREFAKKEAVVVGKAAELPNAKLGRNLGDACYRGISGLERFSDLMECPKFKIAYRSGAEVFMKGRAEGSLRDTSGSSKVVYNQIFVRILVDEIHRLVDDLASRNLMSAGRTYLVQLAL
jgi:hypothetical protein